MYDLSVIIYQREFYRTAIIYYNEGWAGNSGSKNNVRMHNTFGRYH